MQHDAYTLHHRWICTNWSCKKVASLRDSTFYSKSKITQQKTILLIHWWCREYPVSDAAQEAQVEEKRAIQIYQYFRDICSWHLLHHDAPLMLRGSGTAVQIDESLFRHKRKVRQTLCLCTVYMQIKGSNPSMEY